MNLRKLLPAFIVWLVLVGLGFANSAFRSVVLAPNLTESEANVVSVVIQAGLILLTTRIFVGAVKDRYAAKDMLLVGLLWTVLGLGSEVGIALAHGAPWRYILESYNIFQGEFWVVIPLLQLLAPFVIYKLVKK